jgi:hypothetical protein
VQVEDAVKRRSLDLGDGDKPPGGDYQPPPVSPYAQE